MAQKIVGNAELLLTAEEAELADMQEAAKESADVDKAEAEYQNEPNDDDEQCSDCSMFVSGFDTEPGGYCTKVKSFNGPEGMIFDDGWCKFFEKPEDEDLSDLDDLDDLLSKE